MFAVIYQGYVKPGLESKYQEIWKIIATYFIAHRGALGSCLHKSADGLWIAYSRWPNKETRDASWPSAGLTPSKELPESIQIAIVDLKSCLQENRKIAEICMEVVEDFL